MNELDRASRDAEHVILNEGEVAVIKYFLIEPETT